MADGKDILISLPTNNCARILLYIKLHNLEDTIDIKSPKDYGGLTSTEYLRINPQGKFPAFIAAGGSFRLFEAQVILDYIADKYQERVKLSVSPLCQPSSSSPEQRARCRQIIQVHDVYIASANCTQPGYFATQGCMYKAEMQVVDRCAKTRELEKQLDILQDLFDEVGPYCCGQELTLADLVVYPTVIFIADCAPVSLGKDLLNGRSRLQKWFSGLEKSDIAAFQEVGQAVHGFCESAFLKSGRCEQIRATFDCDEARALLN